VRAAGADVTPLSFPSDVSPGIAKAVWGILDSDMQEGFTIEQIGDAYVKGSEAYKEDGADKERIDEINTNIYNQNKDSEEYKVYTKGRELSLDYFKYITTRLGSTFDGFIFESESEVVGKEIIQQNTPKVFEESDGAVIFRGSEHGLFDNVYINSAGFGTYLAKDTGLLSIKFDKYTFDKSITITDIEQKQHFELVKKSAELINKEWAERSLYLQHGRLALTTGKISSRDGGVPLAVDILDTVKSAALKRAVDSNSEISDEVAEQVAIGAIKYAIIRVGMGKNIVFDLEKSLSFEGDSGPYLQYTYARCKSVLAKSGNLARSLLARLHKLFAINHSIVMPAGWQVTNIEKLLYRFPEVVERAALEYEPHYMANYLNELASAYNSWYSQGKILDGSNQQSYKLALTEAVAHTIKNGLSLLGIETPERM
jgi:arginyl-tRNA synthetase